MQTSTTNRPRTWIGSDGHMYRDKETARPFRNYVAAWPHLGKVYTVSQLKGAMRAGAHAYGGYKPFYATDDGAALCDRCVRDNFRLVADAIQTKTSDGWRVVAIAMDNEVEDLHCDNCNAPIGYQTNEQ
jgi:hypothetical protein